MIWMINSGYWVFNCIGWRQGSMHKLGSDKFACTICSSPGIWQNGFLISISTHRERQTDIAKSRDIGAVVAAHAASQYFV